MISIVIPALNEEKLLPRCLASIKSQDYAGEYEIVIVDNGSTDRTAEVARAHGARVVYCARRGVVPARHAGAVAANGEIIVQADADTIYPQGWLSRIARHFAVNRRSVALAGRYVYQDPPLWAWFEYIFRYLLNLLVVHVLGRPALISGANFAFRWEAFIRANGYDAGALSADQWGIATRLSKTGVVDYDHGLVAITSTRRVTNTVAYIMAGFLRHQLRITAHFARFCVQTFATPGRIRLPNRLVRYVAIILPVFVVSTLFYGYAAPGSQLFGRVYYQSESKEKIVALTFEDGPNEPYTTQILDVLAKYRVKATFFLIGENIELSPLSAKQVIADGHVIGNHSYRHSPGQALSSYGLSDLKLAQETIYKVTGRLPHLYRSPKGKTPWELDWLEDEGMIEVTWSVASNEFASGLTFGTPPDKIADEIISKVRPGKIIVLYDGAGTDHDFVNANRSLTVEALPLIIEGLLERGYKFVTVPELLGMPAYNN